MSQYRTGTVSLVNGSAIVTGIATAFLANVAAGNAFNKRNEGVVYQIASVDTDLQVTLSTPYAGVTDPAAQFVISTDFTPNLSLTEINQADVDWPTHLTLTLRAIDAYIAGCKLAKNYDKIFFNAAVNPKPFSQGVAMTYATGGSLGIQVADNDNIDFGTGNFTLVWKGALPDWTPSDTAGAQILMTKYQGSADRWLLYINRTAYNYNIQFDARKTDVTSIAAISTKGALPVIDGATVEILAVITRETVDTAGSVAFYVNGVLWDTVTIPAGTPADISNTGSVTVAGNPMSGVRHASTIQSAITFNRALTAAEVLDLYRNGIAPKHRKASQTALTSGTLVAGQEYTIDTFAAGDDFANVGGTNETGNVFVAKGTAPTTWVNSSSLRATGGTLILEPEGIQPVQWLDAGANRLHAMQPAAGSSLTRTKRDFTIKWTNTWSGTHELQYIGGINQAILPPNCYIDSIIGVIAGGTIEDIIIGDGSDTDRWVTITTGLAAGTVAFTIANAISDGTNYKMTVDPDANFTGSIAWTINGKIL